MSTTWDPIGIFSWIARFCLNLMLTYKLTDVVIVHTLHYSP